MNPIENIMHILSTQIIHFVQEKNLNEKIDADF